MGEQDHIPRRGERSETKTNGAAHVTSAQQRLKAIAAFGKKRIILVYLEWNSPADEQENDT